MGHAKARSEEAGAQKTLEATREVALEMAGKGKADRARQKTDPRS